MPQKMTIFVDMDDTLCDYQTGYQQHQLHHPNLKYPQSAPGLYLSLQPVPGSVATYHWLHSRDDVDLFILTAPSVRNPHCYMEKRVWVETHLGLEIAYRLIICPNKGLLKGDFLIDDNLCGKGQEHFEGQILHFGSEQFPDWQSVKNHLHTVFGK